MAGRHGKGSALTQLYQPITSFVDAAGSVYVADSGNCRVLRWNLGTQEGTLVVDGNGPGSSAN